MKTHDFISHPGEEDLLGHVSTFQVAVVLGKQNQWADSNDSDREFYLALQAQNLFQFCTKVLGSTKCGVVTSWQLVKF
jgi:hypothetical protein